MEYIDTVYHDLHIEKTDFVVNHVLNFIRKNLGTLNFKPIHDEDFKNIPQRFQTHAKTLNKYLR